MTIADSVWVATALLHQERPDGLDFSVQEIAEKTLKEGLVNGFRPGLQVHVSKHCVANKSPNPGRYRMLFETSRGRRRLFHHGDPFHPNRYDGKVRPDKDELPREYQKLIDWYEGVYSKRSDPAPSSPAMTFSGKSAVDLAFPDKSSQVPAFADLLDLQSEPVFVTADGTIALPKRLSLSLGIQAGSCLSAYREGDRLVLQPITDDFIRSLRGSCRPKPGEPSLVEMREREHRLEK